MQQINRKATFEYEVLQTFIAGIVLKGAEIKQIANNKCSIADSFCYITENNECFVKGMHVDFYDKTSLFEKFELKRDRKLLLKRNEIKKIKEKLAEKGLTLIVKKIFINHKGLCKLEICLAKGKKLYDKRESIKKRETERNLARY